ncbi:hypothetical protein [Demequina sp.]|uniref:hypothetical protein n=1 Tax=Demequina sp. TaxID=2050685 RepID=UPI0025BA4D43|nr:hypothetical protein [Demequina sp.]
MAGVTLPDMEVTWRWVEASKHPSAELLLRRAGLDVPWGVGEEEAKAELTAEPTIERCFGAQRNDGSWGPDVRVAARVLPTLWVLKALIEAGLDGRVHQVDRGLTFLRDHATTDAGYFTLTGTDGGVLPCYVGLVARLFRDAGRRDMVGPQTGWLSRYQQVSVAGQARRHADDWGHGLDKRYGGCFATTSCVIGVARAAEVWSAKHNTEQRQAFAAASEALHERSLAFARNGQRLLELPAPRKSPGAWALPAFPSDWRVDLIDVIHAVAQAPGGTDSRAQRAVDTLVASRLEDGSWVRGWHVTSAFLKGFGAVPRGQGSPIVTARALVALTLLAADAG